jgi:hypothetical protein
MQNVITVGPAPVLHVPAGINSIEDEEARQKEREIIGVWQINQTIATSISPEVMYYFKCIQMRKFFRPVENLVNKCQGNALAEAIWFYLKEVGEVHCLICYADCPMRERHKGCPAECQKPLLDVSFIKA